MLFSPTDVDLCKLDERLVQLLAWQRLQQLLPNHKLPMPTTPNPAPNKKVNNTSSGLFPQPCVGEVRARALLCPLTGKGQPVPMPYRTLNIGTGQYKPRTYRYRQTFVFNDIH